MTTGRAPHDYPRSWEADVVLSDGGTVHLRPIVPEDAERLVALHGSLSERTRYLRYFGPYPRMSQRDVERFSTLDHYNRVALIALLGDDILAVGRFDRLDDPELAEVAFLVRDDHQGRGLGSILLEHLAAAGRECELRRFTAEVLTENSAMLGVFRQAGYQVSRSFEEGLLRLELELDPTERSVQVARSREQAAEARSVHNVLHPSSIAVIGASTDPNKIGHALFAHLLSGNFAGCVYPVNAEHIAVRGVRAYRSVLDIPDDVDLAIVAVPAAGVDAVLDECLSKRVTALLVISAGFAESGDHGTTAQRWLVTEARKHGMRVIGPNALGVMNMAPEVRMNATLAPTVPRRGRTGFFCQSGALGIAILATAAQRGLGLSTFVSAGNRADLSGNDLLQYWQTDPETDVVLLYLESFGNPRKFARLARRLGRTKPIVAVASGRHALRPALAETAAEVNDTSVQALFDQAGIIRVDSVDAMFDTALVLAHQPLPVGDRVAVVGNSSALGLLAADVLLAEGMRLACDPADVGQDAGPDEFARAVRVAADREDVDALVVVFAPAVPVSRARYAEALRVAVDSVRDRPVVTTFLGEHGVPAELAASGDTADAALGAIPSYGSPERAVRSLARAWRYARWRHSEAGELVRPPDLADTRACELIDTWLSDGRGELADEELVELLGCYGIFVVDFRLVDTQDTAARAAQELGYPVVLKSVNPDLRHRPDLAGARLDLSSAEMVRAAYTDLRTVSGMDQMYVQSMVPRGQSCVLGVHDDPFFGSLVSFGLAGVASELFEDTAYRAVPLSDVDVAELVRAPRAAPLLRGYRGGQAVDLDALEQLVLRVATLAEDLPQLRELRLEPVVASSSGTYVAGASARIGPGPNAVDLAPRRLR